MGSPLKLFFAALCGLAFALVHIHGELVLMQYPEVTNSRTRNYTCMSTDEGAAFFWSVEGKVYSEKDSGPKRPAAGNVSECAVRGDSACLAGWDKRNEWRVVNSAEKPTGPVYDQRWEDFQEFRTKPESPEYYGVRLVNKPSSTVWFSGRDPTPGHLGVVLCQKEKGQLGPCIIIYADHTTSLHQIDVEVYDLGIGGHDEDLKGYTKTNSITINTTWFEASESDEWQTFRLDWNTTQKTVKMFRGNKSEPFLQADMPAWETVSALGAHTYLIDHGLRFHFYDYYFTDTKNAVISTKRIAHSGRMFCAELLVGLCHNKCKLNVTLVGEDESDIETWLFSGDGQDPYNGLLAWRSVKLNTRFDSNIPRRLTLRIKTILDGDEGTGEWAIDNFHIRQPGQEPRRSTITVPSGQSVVCKELLHAGSSNVKNSNSTSHEAEVIPKMRELFRLRDGPIVDRGGLICNPSGCICDSGFTGRKCVNDCENDFYGFLCTKTCGSCLNSENCDQSTGFCGKGCQGNMIAPICKIALVAPTIGNVGLTAATIFQSVEPDEDEEAIDITIQFREAGGESWVNSTAKLKDSEISSSYEAHITGLKPGTVYTTRAVASVETTGGPRLTFGPPRVFTTCSDPEKSNLMVIPHEESVTIRLRKEEGPICSNLFHPFSVLATDTLLTNRVAFSASGASFPFNVTGLSPSTEYGVKIVDAITQCTLLDTRFRTSAASAPSEVRNFAVESISDTAVSLQWDSPARANVLIRSYNVSLKLVELKACKNLNKCTPPEEEKVELVNQTTVCFDGLHPFAKYAVSVVAQTLKPGPSVTLSLETNSTVIPTSRVSTLKMSEDKGRVEWEEPADCTTITGPTGVVRLYVTRVSDSTLIWKNQTAYSYYNLSNLHLEPLTWYKVRVHVVRGYDQPENPDVYQELTWRANLEDVEAPTVVNVTDRTAKIIQKVPNVGHAGEILVTFILRELWSNKSVAILPTDMGELVHVSDVKNLKPNSLYKVYTLVTILAYDRTATLDSSPILFKTQCLDEPYFEVSPGEEDLTINMPTRPQDCKHPVERSYSIEVYNIAENSLESSLGFSQCPVTVEGLSPDTEYEVKIWIGRRKERHLVNTKVRTTTSTEPVQSLKAELVRDS